MCDAQHDHAPFSKIAECPNLITSHFPLPSPHPHTHSFRSRPHPAMPRSSKMPRGRKTPYSKHSSTSKADNGAITVTVTVRPERLEGYRTRRITKAQDQGSLNVSTGSLGSMYEDCMSKKQVDERKLRRKSADEQEEERERRNKELFTMVEDIHNAVLSSFKKDAHEGDTDDDMMPIEINNDINDDIVTDESVEDISFDEVDYFAKCKDTFFDNDNPERKPYTVRLFNGDKCKSITAGSESIVRRTQEGMYNLRKKYRNRGDETNLDVRDNCFSIGVPSNADVDYDDVDVDDDYDCRDINWYLIKDPNPKSTIAILSTEQVYESDPGPVKPLSSPIFVYDNTIDMSLYIDELHKRFFQKRDGYLVHVDTIENYKGFYYQDSYIQENLELLKKHAKHITHVVWITAEKTGVPCGRVRGEPIIAFLKMPENTDNYPNLVTTCGSQIKSVDCYTCTKPDTIPVSIKHKSA